MSTRLIGLNVCRKVEVFEMDLEWKFQGLVVKQFLDGYENVKFAWQIV